jgi:hypothetical protein
MPHLSAEVPVPRSLTNRMMRHPGGQPFRWRIIVAALSHASGLSDHPGQAELRGELSCDLVDDLQRCFRIKRKLQ